MEPNDREGMRDSRTITRLIVNLRESLMESHFRPQCGLHRLALSTFLVASDKVH